MTTEELNITVPATAALDESRAWAEYLDTTKPHRGSPTYETVEPIAWQKLIQTLAHIMRVQSDERRHAKTY